MLSIPSRARLASAAAFLSFYLLAACGGRGGNPDPTPPPSPDPNPPVLASTFTDVAEGITLGQANWEDGSGSGAPIDGVNCAASQSYHIHALISIYREGTRLALPASIGLRGCTYELHTDDRSGVVHVETDAQKTFTVGQFFSVWGQPLGASNVAGLTGTVRFYLIDNGTITPYTGNPADIELKRHQELAIVVGTPPAAVANHRWGPNL